MESQRQIRKKIRIKVGSLGAKVVHFQCDRLNKSGSGQISTVQEEDACGNVLMKSTIHHSYHAGKCIPYFIISTRIIMQL